MFEHHTQPLLSKKAFTRRFVRFAFAALLLVSGSLTVGIVGYRFFENMSWIDALLNASMILGGMGPVNLLTTTNGKLFASFYALFSGVVFVLSAGVLLAPLLHRFLHTFHLQEGRE